MDGPFLGRPCVWPWDFPLADREGDEMDDIRPVVRDDACSMIYAEIAAVRGISAASAEWLGYTR
jgi:hypothetical protein